MFKKEVYEDRRRKLDEGLESGLVLLSSKKGDLKGISARSEAQGSSFDYFFGYSGSDLWGLMDLEAGEDFLCGKKLSEDDLVWRGETESLEEKAEKIGVTGSYGLGRLKTRLAESEKKGRKIHLLPPANPLAYRDLEKLTGWSEETVEEYVSEDLIKEIVGLRSVKSEKEIEEIERALEVTEKMHRKAMRAAKTGTIEREILAEMIKAALSEGQRMAFKPTTSIDGQVLHNRSYSNRLKEGDLLVNDAGSESPLGYAGDITRTVPVDGEFEGSQKDVYSVVLSAQRAAIDSIEPGLKFREVHLEASRQMASGLRDMGIMKGDVEAAVETGAHALFFPHGLGHMLGLDVHDMDDLGEDYVGYDEEVKRSDQFGLDNLRLARRLKAGYAITVEPGIYFIPRLIDRWREEGKFRQFINYEKLEDLKDFGGIRIEDDILVTKDGCRLLGPEIPKEIPELEKEVQGRS